MSKSYNNTISIFGEEKQIRKKIMGIQMDSRTPDEPKPDADKNNAIILMKLLNPEIAKEYEDKLRAGGLGYGDLKKALFSVYWEYFAEARTRRAELLNNLDYVRQTLKDGAERASAIATIHASASEWTTVKAAQPRPISLLSVAIVAMHGK